MPEPTIDELYRQLEQKLADAERADRVRRVIDGIMSGPNRARDEQERRTMQRFAERSARKMLTFLLEHPERAGLPSVCSDCDGTGAREGLPCATCRPAERERVLVQRRNRAAESLPVSGGPMQGGMDFSIPAGDR